VRTAIDTNVISALWSEEPQCQSIVEALKSARIQGGLVIAAPVYAELLSHPHSTVRFLERFLDGGGIEVDFQLDREVWKVAGVRFSHYMARRRSSKESSPRRLLADFIIGAHALLRVDRLMTMDLSRYRRDFPELKLVAIP
jgi:predicted nucleic acid-binding protein